MLNYFVQAPVSKPNEVNRRARLLKERRSWYGEKPEAHKTQQQERNVSATHVLKSAAVAAAFVAVVSAWPGPGAAGEVPPEGVTQILPRGGIPAIFEPRFVPAMVADIPDSAWVIGVVIGEEARAYDINLLNHHEIVNDVVAGVPVAPVW